MKKIFFMLLFLTLSIVQFSCKKKDGSNALGGTTTIRIVVTGHGWFVKYGDWNRVSSSNNSSTLGHSYYGGLNSWDAIQITSSWETSADLYEDDQWSFYVMQDEYHPDSTAQLNIKVYYGSTLHEETDITGTFSNARLGGTIGETTSAHKVEIKMTGHGWFNVYGDWNLINANNNSGFLGHWYFGGLNSWEAFVVNPAWNCSANLYSTDQYSLNVIQDSNHPDATAALTIVTYWDGVVHDTRNISGNGCNANITGTL